MHKYWMMTTFALCTILPAGCGESAIPPSITAATTSASWCGQLPIDGNFANIQKLSLRGATSGAGPTINTWGPAPNVIGEVDLRLPCTPSMPWEPYYVEMDQAGGQEPLRNVTVAAGHASTAPQSIFIWGRDNATDGIHTFLVNDDDVPVDDVAKGVFVWQAKYLEMGGSQNQIADNPKAIHVTHPGIRLARYMTLLNDFNDQPSGAPMNGTLSWYENVQNNHKDWLLYTCDDAQMPVGPAVYPDARSKCPEGMTLEQCGDDALNGYYNAYPPLDFTKQEVRDFLVNNLVVTAAQQGFDAIALDDFEFPNTDVQNGYRVCGSYTNQNGTLVWTHRAHLACDANGCAQTDEDFLHDLFDPGTGWIPYLTSQAHIHGLAVIINYSRGNTADTPFGNPPISPDQAILNSVDGVFDENQFIDESTYTLKNNDHVPPDWQGEVTWMRDVQQAGKMFFGVNGISGMGQKNVFTPIPDDDPFLQWAMASHLMGDYGGAAFWLDRSKNYDIKAWRDDYGTAIGTPCPNQSGNTTDMYQDLGGAWVRRFQHAIAAANPYTDQYIANHGQQRFTIPANVQLPQGVQAITDVGGNATYTGQDNVPQMFQPGATITLDAEAGLVLRVCGCGACP